MSIQQGPFVFALQILELIYIATTCVQKINVRSTQSPNLNDWAKWNFGSKSGGDEQDVSAEPTRLWLLSHLKIGYAVPR